MSDKDLPVIDLQLVPIGEGVTLHFGNHLREFLAPFQKLVDDGKARWPDPPPPDTHWPAVASVSWQDQEDPWLPMVIPEAINRTVRGGEMVILCDRSDGDSEPMVALGWVTKLDNTRKLVTLRRVTEIFSPDHQP